MNSKEFGSAHCTPMVKGRAKDALKTPRARKLFYDKEFVDKSTKLKDIGLAGTLWKTYRINALYNFSYKKEKLKQYQMNLASYVNKAILENSQESQDEPQEFIIKIEPVAFTAFTKYDMPALQISIFEAVEEYRVSCFTGYLLSIGRKEGFLEMYRVRAGAVVLPLFLVEYADKMFLDCVISFLQDSFQCLVSSLKFSQYDLMWMLALWSRPQNKNHLSATILEYNVPLEELSSIEYVIDPKSLSDAWKPIMVPDDAGEISENQVNAFLSVLEKHFSKMFSIDLSHFQLAVIKTPIARVEGDHSIIVLESDQLFSIMRHLTHLAQEIIK